MTSIAPAVATLYLPPDDEPAPPVHVNFHLRQAGALVEHHDVAGFDHGYDGNDDAKAREVYALIARHPREATGGRLT